MYYFFFDIYLPLLKIIPIKLTLVHYFSVQDAKNCVGHLEDLPPSTPAALYPSLALTLDMGPKRLHAIGKSIRYLVDLLTVLLHEKREMKS